MSVDHFAVMGQPRRPWLEPEALKDCYHRMAASAHPDGGGSPAGFAALNAAYEALREPAKRLRHLLELEAPEALAQSAADAPTALAERFLAIATLRRETDVFVRQQAAATTPLAKALMAGEREMQRRDLEKALAELDAERDRCLETVRAIDLVWGNRSTETMRLLADVQRQLAYLAKWSAQLRETILLLDL